MTVRSRRETITFKHPCRIKGIDRLLSAGAYEVITDEEMIEGLSFAAFRRVATMIAGGRAARFNNGDGLHQLDRSVRCAVHRCERAQ
jgi:hypothetical protein